MLKDTIKKLRTEQGLSQDELAERIHVVRQTVSKWERGTSVPDADSLVALARALGVSAAELLGESAMAEKKPDDLAWETSLLDERITSESQRLDRLVRSLKWVFVGAAAMALAFGLFVWLPNQQFSYVIWWDSVADDPDYCKIVYRLDGEEKSMRLSWIPRIMSVLLAALGSRVWRRPWMQRELLKKPGGLDALSERANQAIEAMGGTVLRHELWLPAASREDDDPTNDDVPYSVCFYADSDDQDIPWL